MIHSAHRFALLLEKADGAALGQLPLNPNWEPAFECSVFAAQRAGCRAVPSDARVEPVADAALGLPYAAGFRIVLDGLAGTPAFPISFFAREARRVAASLVAGGKLKEGDRYQYRLLAFAHAGPAAPERPVAFDVGELDQPLPVRDGSLDPLLAASVAVDENGDALAPAFIPASVIEETRALALAAGAKEVGGILVGRLVRDASLPEIALVVTAQIPARQALGEADKLTFTPETWAAVEQAIALRRSDEIIGGWWHSHPARSWCAAKNCPAEERRACVLQQGFFSADDVRLHENVFPKAFHVALVVTDADDACRHALFGWQEGTVRHRGYRLLTATGSPPGAHATTTLNPPKPRSDSESPMPPGCAPEP
jgi:hypothetical protein